MTKQTQVRSTEEAMKLALEALNSFPTKHLTPFISSARTAIREALDSGSSEESSGTEQPAQQEPVFSFKMQLKPGWGSQYPTPCVIGDPDLRSLFGKVGDVVTFYTFPPTLSLAQRQSRSDVKPLTDEEIHKASTQAGMQEHYMGFHSGFVRFARAIEAKLKEKNT